jgi:uncharacterized protein (TIGR03084 family)
MVVDIAALLVDLGAETTLVEAWLEPLAPIDWSRPTPAHGWAIADQVSHLAYFDDMAVLAATEPDAFVARRAEAVADVDGFTARIAAEHRARPPDELFAWFRTARTALVATFAPLDPSARVPWYGPDMSVASAVTARIMETWAHGHDIADALGVEHPATGAVAHVAHLGVRTRLFSFSQRGLDPGADVRVELIGPHGEAWTWGPEGAPETVRGPAFDFCLVVTQRRHIADTDLVVVGPSARRWMEIAQAFAGPPGSGRTPAQQ